MDDTYQNPTRECDLVMQGGITSGVVYPPAVLKLARDYRLRSIGGTSVGAMAATAVAAAEYGREEGGFERLELLNEQLTQPGFILGLFQPTTQTRPLMRTLQTLLEHPHTGRLRIGIGLALAMVRNNVLAMIIGALLGMLLTGLGVLLVGGRLVPGTIIFLLLAAVAGGLVGGIVRLLRILLQDVPANFFGLCSGRTENGDGAGLTDWMETSIAELSGRKPAEPPLTFADLEAKSAAGQACAINLRMVTTNLSQQRPYVLPFDSGLFLFAADEWRRLFPESVVQYLIGLRIELPQYNMDQIPGYYWLPDDSRLPVLVGMRLSLSFPLLISAVPLYTIRRSALHRQANGPVQLTRADLQRNWFSDGGICSNFPIQFFDSLLPTRPTFGLNLVGRPAEMFEEGGASAQDSQLAHDRLHTDFQSTLEPGSASMQSDARDVQITSDTFADDPLTTRAVFIPRADDPITADWQALNGIFAFGWSIFGTAQTYRDTLQSMLPGYRDRIVRIYFGPDEGGLNLAMSPATINGIQEKGRQAATKITNYFVFQHHRWARLIVLMEVLENRLRELEEALQAESPDRLFEAQFDSQNWPDPDERFPYARSLEWCELTRKRLQILRQANRIWGVPMPYEGHPPSPEPTLRVTPEI
jgi:predicted acylesterase/phospholipase RssA